MLSYLIFTDEDDRNTAELAGRQCIKAISPTDFHRNWKMHQSEKNSSDIINCMNRTINLLCMVTEI